jgi:hypothetical protein
MKPIMVLLLIAVFLAACAPAGETSAPVTAAPTIPPQIVAATPAPTATAPAIATGAPTVAAAATDTSAPTAELTAGPVATATVAAVTYGRTDDGTYFYGSPDAPVTLTDYSDFL